MSPLYTQVPTNTWSQASWDEYLQVSRNPIYDKAKGYYHKGWMRLEMGTGSARGIDNSIIFLAISLYCIAKGLVLKGLINSSYRKTAVGECQPDLSYYIGEHAELAPYDTAIVDLDHAQVPDLAVEISDTSVADDLGKKRLLIEEMGISEYWVVEVQTAQVMMFRVSDPQSQPVSESTVLKGLTVALLNQVLERSKQMDQTQLGAWLMQYFQR
jgi:Uma2 family endonuclease